jgi:hypothetical protein
VRFYELTLMLCFIFLAHESTRVDLTDFLVGDRL